MKHLHGTSFVVLCAGFLFGCTNSTLAASSATTSQFVADDASVPDAAMRRIATPEVGAHENPCGDIDPPPISVATLGRSDSAVVDARIRSIEPATTRREPGPYPGGFREIVEQVMLAEVVDSTEDAGNPLIFLRIQTSQRWFRPDGTVVAECPVPANPALVAHLHQPAARVLFLVEDRAFASRSGQREVVAAWRESDGALSEWGVGVGPGARASSVIASVRSERSRWREWLRTAPTLRQVEITGRNP